MSKTSFRIGAHVVGTQLFRDMFPGACDTGIVTRSEPGYFVRVRRDGRKNAETYHPSYWRLAPKEGRA